MRVLDVGAGAGIYADLLSRRSEYIDAVEIFDPYVQQFGLRQKYRNVYVRDFSGFEPPSAYDVVLLGDVLEHFAPDDALEVWDRARRIAGDGGIVLLSTPVIEWPQGAEYGNVHETHLSFFNYQDLTRLPGFESGVEGEIIGSVRAFGYTPEASDLTVVVTTIPTREDRLEVALRSVADQSLLPARVVVQCDEKRLGAPANRDLGLSRVDTKYVAFLDDDDYFYANHLQLLYSTAVSEQADLVYSWFDVIGGTDPFPQNFGKPWDPCKPVQTTVTTLGRTLSYLAAGGYASMEGFSSASLAQGNTAGEDYRLVWRMNREGMKIIHVPEKSWAYVHHSKNTSGRADRW